MSRCTICDTLLTQYELAAKYSTQGHELATGFVDLCAICITAIADNDSIDTTEYGEEVVSSSGDDID